MKTKNIIFGTLLAIGLCMGCDSKDKLTDTTTLSQEDLTNESNIDAAIEDVSNLVEDQYNTISVTTAKSANVTPKYLPDCATVTTTVNSTSWIRVIDFGSTGCTLKNGNIIKGKITVSFSKSTTETTKTLSYTFENFYHNGNMLVGNKSIEVTKKATTTLNVEHPVLTHNIDMTVTFADGKSYTRTGTIIREFIKGYDTIDWEDNELSISGNTTTTLPTGGKINNTITSNLIIKASCKMVYPVKGSITIVKNGNTGVIDFGEGICDKLATVTVKGITVIITLK